MGLQSDDLPLGNNIVDSLLDGVGVLVETEVSEHEDTGEEHGSGVSLVLALNVKTDVTATGLEDGNIISHVAARDNTRATDKGSTDVGEDAAVKVGGNEDVELLGPADALHRGVIDNHVVDLEAGVALGDLVESASEKTIGKLHDVGLVDTSNLLALVGLGKVKGETGNALRLLAGDDLERLDDAGYALVLEAGVLALGVLTDDAHVNTVVARLVAGDVLDHADGGVDVEVLAHGDVEALVAGSGDGGVEDALETDLVAAKGVYALVEHGLGALDGGLEGGDVNLLPLHGGILGLEDGLDALGDFGADTVTGNEGYCVLSAGPDGVDGANLEGRVGTGEEGLSSGGSHQL